jgi:ArsR family transcriptional regulator, arsenate/arsenite/antimonite-responsive transcriptional repressor
MTRSLLDVQPAAVETVEDAEACCAPVFDGHPALQPEEATRHAVVLKALGDPHRLRMLSIMAAQPAGEPLCVCEIEGEFGLSQPTISHHLRVLREAGLVTVTKRGLWHYYAPAVDGLAPVRRMLDTLAGV